MAWACPWPSAQIGADPPNPAHVPAVGGTAGAGLRARRAARHAASGTAGNTCTVSCTRHETTEMMSLSRGFRGDAGASRPAAARARAAVSAATPGCALPRAGIIATTSAGGPLMTHAAGRRGGGISHPCRRGVPGRHRPVPIKLGPLASDRPQPSAGDRLDLRRAADRNLRQAIGRNFRQATELTPS
jgi:hypothetical protein